MKLEEKISKIYEVIADKTLSFGCKIIFSEEKWDNRECIILDDYWVYEDWPIEFLWQWWEPIDRLLDYIEIIWHPVMIWDVLDWIIKNIHEIKHYNCDLCWRVDILEDMLGLWENKRKPIEEQSAETIDFIYSLIE